MTLTNKDGVFGVLNGRYLKVAGLLVLALLSALSVLEKGEMLTRSPQSLRSNFHPHCWTQRLIHRASRDKFALRSSIHPINTMTIDPKSEGIICSPSSKLLGVAENIPELLSYENWYRSPKWLENSHLHTIFASTARKAPCVRFERVLLKTADDGRLALDILREWPVCEDCIPERRTEQNPNQWLLLVSGLGGGSEDSYVQSMCASAANRGWNVAVLNMRGCGNSPITSPRFFSAMRGSVDDMRQAVSYMRTYLRDEDSSEPMVVAAGGWSNGATIVNNYAALQETDASYGPAHRIDLAATLCCPFDMPAADRGFRRPFSKLVYDRALTRKLISKIRENTEVFQKMQPVSISGKPIDLDLEKLLNARTVREIDAELTIKSFEYPTVDAYYADSSSEQRLADIQIPTIMISALDDPLIPDGGIPESQIISNDDLMLVTTKHGGHLGWVEANSADNEKRWCPEWTESVVLNFLEQLRNRR